MATILSLALKVNADASGVVKNLTPAERALQKLAGEADKVTSVFDTFAKSSEAAAAAQRQAATDFGFLASYLKTGKIDAQQFADEYERLKAASQETADAFARGAEVTRQYKTEEQQRAETVDELTRLLALGAISQETYATAVYQGSDAQNKAVAAERERLELLGQGQRLAEQFATTEERRAKQLADVERLLLAGAISEESAARARAEFSGQNAAAIQAEKDLAFAAEESAKRRAAAEKEAADFIDKVRGDIDKEVAIKIAEAEKIRSQAIASAARIIEANLTPQERYDKQMQELNTHLQEGRLSQEQFNRAAARAEQDLNGVAKEATAADDNIDNLNKNVSLLAKIEIVRLVIDGLQALGSVFTRVTDQVSSLVTSVNSSLDTLGDFSARTGVSVEVLQGYSLAAKLAGVDTEQFLGAVQKLAVNIGKATPGDALDKSLRGINLSLQELRGLSPEDQFSAIGAAISELPTAADRAAAAVEIFGQQGAALAPLFADGIGSLKELEAEGRKLGAIVSDVQVDNVDEMNKAFDKVRATVQGIVGQVLGNLAPAVTDVTNQFLEFVKTWEGTGTQGTGGNGIANAITDVLLQGAEYFAGIFDEFVANFGSLGETFSFAADVFEVTSKILLTASEGIRVAFNAVQIGIDALLIGFGKIVEALGSYVSDDLEQFGAGLAAASQESADRNAREMEAAAANAANTFNSIFNGGQGNAEAAGQGAASQYLRGLRNEIDNARKPEVQLELNLDQTQERLQQFLATAGEDASQFLQESVAAVETFQQMAEAGELTADQIAIMNGFMENVNAELDQELATRREAAEAATAQAEADQKRIDTLLGASDAAAKIEQDLQAIQREQARVSEELAAARAADNQTQADAAAARQGELDQLQASLEEQQQALEQGFSQGFQAAFDNVNQNIDGLIAKSQQFGQAGFDAALRLQEGIAAAQQQAQDGILNQEAFNAEVQRQQDLFNQEIENLEEIKRREKQASDEAAAAEKQQNADLLKAQDEYRKQQQTALQAYQQQQQQAQQAYAQEQARIFEEQRKAAEAEAKRQEERIRKLNTLGQQSISVADVRSVEGANLVLQTAAQAQDPALIQARLQTKLLERVALGIGQAASNYFNQPVAIVGAARLN